MIGFFPPLYEDELLYSWFARYYVHSGYTSTIDSYRDLYENINIHPSVEFVNNLTCDAVSVVSKYASLNELVKQHTLFPEYGRFIAPSKREMLMNECDFMKGNWSNTIKISGLKHKRCLRYCPLCVSEDRQKYGETFWHTKHQITGIMICTKHRTALVESSVALEKNLSRFKAAEAVIDGSAECYYCNSMVVIKLAEYMETVFDDEKYSHNRIGKYLNSRLPDRYFHVNGDRTTYALYDDYRSFYSDVGEEYLVQPDYFTKSLRGVAASFYYVCQMAMFEGIAPAELLREGDDYEEDDLFWQLSKKLDEPVELVEKIGKAILKEMRTDNESITRRIRYNNYINEEDDRMLPRVITQIEKTYGHDDLRPRKVTITGISKSLGIDAHKFKKLRKCREEVEKYYETQEEYWAREIIWAVKKLESSRERLSAKKIRDYTRIKKSNVLACLPTLMSKDKRIYDIVYELHNDMPGS